MFETTKRKPQRTCLGCKTSNDQDRFLRVFRDAGGRVLLYEGGSLAGRSAYICENERCIEIALTKDRLARALRAPVTAQAKDDLKDRLLRKVRLENRENDS